MKVQDGEKLGIKTVNEEVGNLTISAGITNIKDDELFIKFNIRYPASIDEKTLDSRLKNSRRKREELYFLKKITMHLFI